MRILYFRLKGYVNILQGMGLDEIAIPFSQFQNRIVLIQGENGTGKSTILKALTPIPDGSDSFRTDVIVDPNTGIQQIVEYPGEKEIHYGVWNSRDQCEDIYRILIQSVVNESRTSRTTKAYISKNGVELNPNGTVSGFKDLRDEMLDIDSTYLDMSMISSENRGLVDMTPSERKRYLSLFIGSLETFNQLNKNLSKIASTCKGQISDLAAKINSIGDPVILAETVRQDTEYLEKLKKNRDDLLSKISESESTIRLLDPDNKIQDTYGSISEDLGRINTSLKQLSDKESTLTARLDPKFLKSDNVIGEYEELKKNREEYNISLNDYQSKISATLSMIDNTSSSIDESKSTLASISSTEIKSNIEADIDSIMEDISLCESSISMDKDILNNVKKSTMVTLKIDLDKIISKIDSDIESISDRVLDTLKDCFEHDISSKDLYATVIRSCDTSIQTNSDSIDKNTKLLEQYEKDKARIALLNNRPSDCVNDSCPFIADIISLKEEWSEERLNEIEREIRVAEESIKATEEFRADRIAASSILEIIESIYNTLSKYSEAAEWIESLEHALNKFNILNIIDSHNKFRDLINEVARIIPEYDIIDYIATNKDKVSNMTADLKVYQTNKVLIDQLNSTIDKAQQSLDKYNSDITKYRSQVEFFTNLIREIDTQLEILSDIIKIREEEKQLNLEKDKLKEKYETIKENIRTVKTHIDGLNDLKNELNNVDNSIGPLTHKVNANTFALTNLEMYKAEYNEIDKKYSNIGVLRKYCSAGVGNSIQSGYIEIYMNGIMETCNRILSAVYRDVAMCVPIITDREFSIPFIGQNQILVPDISAGSTSQKCMFGLAFACAAISKSSPVYNIMRFDEIDSGLDTENRTRFIAALNDTLNMMNAQQCILISHNMEFDTASTSKIVCSSKGVSFVQ